jgi:hypothetical protein
MVLGRSGRTNPSKGNTRSVPEQRNMTSFPKTRSKPAMVSLSALEYRVSTPTLRGIWMTRETGSPALRGSFASAASSHRTDSDCSGSGRSLRSKSSTTLAAVRSSRTGQGSPAEYPVHRREIWLGQSRGTCVVCWQQSPRYGCQPSLLPPGCVAHAPWAMLFVACLDLSLLCSARFFAFVEVPALQ